MGRKGLSIEEKFEIMYKYLEENNAFETGIRARTKFGEYPIGNWQDHLRHAYYIGELKIDKDLKEKLLKYGILRKEKERETAKRMSWDEKYTIMEEYLLSGKKLRNDTVYNGYKIGQWQAVLRHLFYTDSLNAVSPELKKKFLKLGILKKEKHNSNCKGSTKTTYTTKFEIMYRYLVNTDFEQGINQKTTFEGFNIGSWQDNLRQSYRKGNSLDISPELMEKFFAYGILREEDEKVRKSRNLKKQGKLTERNIEDEKEQLINQLLKKQEERRRLDNEIMELQNKIEEMQKDREF